MSAQFTLALAAAAFAAAIAGRVIVQHARGTLDWRRELQIVVLAAIPISAFSLASTTSDVLAAALQFAAIAAAGAAALFAYGNTAIGRIGGSLCLLLGVGGLVVLASRLAIQ